MGTVLSMLRSPPSHPLHAPAHQELSYLGIVNDHIVAQYEGSESTIEVED